LASATTANYCHIAPPRSGLYEGLPELWEQIPRRKAPHPTYVHQRKVILTRFAEFVATKQKGVTDFVEVKPETAKAFMAAEGARGVSPKTWNDVLKLLRSTFKHLHPHLSDGSNPFYGLLTKTTVTVNREPFTVEELKAILAACADDDFVRPLVVTGMCTAMRRGDCCQLKWKDVDLKDGFITVKTAKTAETVDIPVFPLLREELEKAQTSSGKSKLCFPAAAEMYRNNPDGITWRVKQVIARALEGMVAGDRPLLPDTSPEQIRAKGLAYFDGLGESAKTESMRKVFTTYIDGHSFKDVMAETGRSRGAVSSYLNEIQRETGCKLIRDTPRRASIEGLQAVRSDSKRKASVRDFHSFRVTWITLALASGVPLELVQRVTGHRTVEVVMKHYFRPGREDFRQVILKAMPKMLADGGAQRSVKDQVLAILEASTAKTWRLDKANLLDLISAI